MPLFSYWMFFFLGLSLAQAYFPNTYEQAHENFINNGSKISSKLPDSVLGLEDFNDSTLSVPYLYLPGKKSNKLVIMISGVHGVEGFVGSAVINQFLIEQYQDFSELSFLIIHTVNPYGMKNFQRVNQNNIDLNRNCFVDDNNYQKQRPEYSAISAIINPSREYHHNFWNRLILAFKAFYQTFSLGKVEFRKSLINGQYQQSDGIFYGGSELAMETRILQKIVTQFTKEYQKILFLDWHTGYGKRGEIHLFGSGLHNEITSKRIQYFFDGLEIDQGDSGDFYQPTGDTTVCISELLSGDPSKVVIPMTLEIGTADSQNLWGAFKSLERMIRENQVRHYNKKKSESFQIIKREFVEHFYPTDGTWRAEILNKSKKLINELLTRMQGLE